MYVRQEGAANWCASSTQVSIAAGNLAQLYSTCVGSGRHRQLADFDDHLDDLTRSAALLALLTTYHEQLGP